MSKSDGASEMFTASRGAVRRGCPHPLRAKHGRDCQQRGRASSAHPIRRLPSRGTRQLVPPSVPRRAVSIAVLIWSTLTIEGYSRFIAPQRWMASRVLEIAQNDRRKAKQRGSLRNPDSLIISLASSRWGLHRNGCHAKAQRRQEGSKSKRRRSSGTPFCNQVAASVRSEDSSRLGVFARARPILAPSRIRQRLYDFARWMRMYPACTRRKSFQVPGVFG